MEESNGKAGSTPSELPNRQDKRTTMVLLTRKIEFAASHLNNEVAELAGQIPTCENVARVIWQLLEPKITQCRLHRVRLYESPDLFADCYRNGAGAGAAGKS